jgi:methionyl-tRNA synthetase
VDTHLSLSDDKGDVDRVKRPWDLLSAGHKIGTSKPLFRELVCGNLWKLLKGLKLCFCFRVIDVFKILYQKDEEVEVFRKKFEGSQADRVVRAEAEAAENVAEQLKKTKVSGVYCIHF